MNRFRLRQWLSLNESTIYLSQLLNEPVSEFDIYRLALDGHLVLSVSFWNNVDVYYGEFVDSTDVSFDEIEIKNIKVLVPKCEQIANDTFFKSSGDIAKISDIWDLPLVAGEKVCIELLAKKASNQEIPEHLELIHLNGVFVTNQNKTVYCKILEKGLNNENSYTPAIVFPEGSELVVRVSELENFFSKIKQPKKSSDDDITLNNALAIMAILLAKNKADCRVGNRPNASAIGKKVDELAQVFFGQDVRGYKAFHKKIEKALTTFEDELSF